MNNYRPSLEKGMIYHIYNHAVGKENLFIEDKNYKFFLEKFEKYIVPLISLYAFCLMPNHFHLVLQVKECKNQSVPELSSAFRNFFTSYTNSFNKIYQRNGSLFEQRFKRKIVEDNLQLIQTIVYIHKNPVAHGFVENPEDWKYSSYCEILNCKKTPLLMVDEVIKLFDNIENFIFCHQPSDTF